MDVFLTGATGYIGSAIALALQAKRHHVIGLARSEQSAQRLADQGIQVHRGDLTDPECLAQATIDADAVIHAASTNSFDAAQVDLTAVESILTALKGTNKPFVYTSGTWVMGNTGKTPADEDSPLDPTPLVAWRPLIEKLVLTAAKQNIRTVVIRPALVYGRGGGVIAQMIQTARQNGFVQIIGTGENRWSLVHINDLAQLYVKALESAPAGTLLIGTNESSFKVLDVAQAVSNVAEARGCVKKLPLEEARKVMGVFADALVLDQQTTAAKAKRLLNWIPQAPSLLDEIEQELGV